MLRGARSNVTSLNLGHAGNTHPEANNTPYVAPVASSLLLLEDDSSQFLLEDGTSGILLE